ncbi:hypothetical protein F53441_2764 [Fusarium austroafricanum]|uniref:DUF1308 domain-containing protein n=1 Tax=Fusarium austroafricanum TaxID=2364996 RepID=A0A8H4KQE9_9HYPO|nr:hypothetical protein F53441_2764 [Fusarium austroafricanum]
MLDVPDSHSTSQPNGTEITLRQSRMLDSARRHSTLLTTTIHEIKQFAQALESKSRPVSSCGLPTFLRDLERENTTFYNLVTELSSTNFDDQQLTLRERKLDASITISTQSIAQWNRLKKSHGFVAINQSFQGSSKILRRQEIEKRQVSGKEKHNMHRTLKEQARVEVDVVQEGREWIAVKAVSRDRLARQMNDCGWGWGDHELGDQVDRDEWEDAPLAKYVQRLVNAARMNRHEYRFPHIRLVLTNLSRGEEELDILLHQLENMDPLVQVIIEDQNSDFVTMPHPPLDEAISNLIGNELTSLTHTVNLDHTILIDLISDLTHLKLRPQPWQSRTTRAQIEEENAHAGGLMSRVLYPVLAGRKLVCTREAADHFHDVLRSVGTATERERGRLLIPWGDNKQETCPNVIRERFQQLTIYPLPSNVQIPVTVIDEPWDMEAIKSAVSQGTLPQVAQDVAFSSAFKSSKLSIFMYGWAAGLTTVTSNKEVRGQIRTWVEAHRKHDEEFGPHIWRLEVTRNLLAKAAKPREGWQEKDGVDADEGDDE